MPSFQNQLSSSLPSSHAELKTSKSTWRCRGLRQPKPVPLAAPSLLDESAFKIMLPLISYSPSLAPLPTGLSIHMSFGAFLFSTSLTLILQLQMESQLH